MDLGISEPGTQEVLCAASQHDIKELESLINTCSFPDCKVVDVQDPETGSSPLHAAIASGKPGTEGKATEVTSSDASTIKGQNPDAARDTVVFLLENGAIWNQLDRNDETPACIAWRFGLKELYELMVEAGVRAEILLNRLEGYMQLADEDDEVVEEGNGHGEPDVAEQHENDEQVQRKAESPENEARQSATSPPPSEPTNPSYLSSALSQQPTRLLDSSQNAVMMSWETSIMHHSADAILTSANLIVLNIGFGMGIVDTYISTHASARSKEHHIIEAHRDVLTSMQQADWFDKPGVTIHAGRWQDILPQFVAAGHTFDAVYFDTFAESYADFRDFFTEYMPMLLSEDGSWSFFNGMGADRRVSYDVYQRVVEMDLFEAGWAVSWEEIDVPEQARHGEWDGVKRRYWADIDRYRVPVCRFLNE